MIQSLKPASLLLHLLSILTFFLLGMFYAGWVEAGKNQGLAGGAIVFGYGVMFAGIGLVASILFSYLTSFQKIKYANWTMFFLLVVGIGITYYKFEARKKAQDNIQSPKGISPDLQTKPAEALQMRDKGSNDDLYHFILSGEENSEMGMGFFAPYFQENDKLYFYGDPNSTRTTDPNKPQDSILFGLNQFNHLDITSAPPWLVPEILKLDYDMLYFKMLSVNQDFVEVVVNSVSGQTAYVSRAAGQVIHWPDFLLGVHSVEFFPESKETIKVRPFDISDPVKASYAFMKVVKVRGEWAEVLLINEDYESVGKGWIQWARNNKLLVSYNLLS